MRTSSGSLTTGVNGWSGNNTFNLFTDGYTSPNAQNPVHVTGGNQSDMINWNVQSGQNLYTIKPLELNGPQLTHRTFHHYRLFRLAKLFAHDVSGPLDTTLYGLGCVVNRTCVDARIKLHYTFAFYFTPVDEEHAEVSSMLAMRKLPVPFVTSLLLRKGILEGKRTIDQDVPIWENKRYRERPILCEGDGPIMQYRKWAAQFYALR